MIRTSWALNTIFLCFSAIFLLNLSNAFGNEVYYAANPSDQGEVILVGLSESTTVTIEDLDSGEIIYIGYLGRLDVESVQVDKVHHFKLSSSDPVLAYLGYDCCAVGGTSFIPTEDGHSRVGNAFVIYLPILGPQSDLIIFALEDSHVALSDEDGLRVNERTLEGGQTWIPYPIIGGRPYVVRSTGDITILLNAVNGLTTVPPTDRTLACDNDVGRLFYFATHSWGTGGFVAYAYEEASFTITQIGASEPLTAQNLKNGQWYFQNGLRRHTYVLESTGDIAVWAGDMEGGETIADLGDDFSMNLGLNGTRTLVHTQNHGATVFAPYDGTEIELGEEIHSLAQDEWITIEPLSEAEIVSNQPVVTMTYGGNTLNDWGGFLRPVPHFPVTEDPCPDRDADLPSWPDSGVDGDADLDADSEGDVDAEIDEDGSDVDADLPIHDGDDALSEPRRSCDCVSAGRNQRFALPFLRLFSVFDVI